jgi:RNA polymerase sigma-70 factor (ECF subfamily)
VDGLVLAAALRGLPPAQRQVLALHHAAGLPVREIAELLGVPVGTVKARLARGRAALAALLVEAEEVDLRDR